MRQYQQRQKSVHVGQNFAFYYLNFFYSWKVLIVWYVFLTEIRIILTVCSYHVMHAFQSESALYSCLNIKELLARNKRDI